MTNYGEYTQKEMLAMVPKMREVSTTFYYSAQRVGNHAFIEFCGLMNKYIDLFEIAAKRGDQAPFANKHSGRRLGAQDHDMIYLAEKFDCIFGSDLQDPNCLTAFGKEMGWEIKKASVEPADHQQG